MIRILILLLSVLMLHTVPPTPEPDMFGLKILRDYEATRAADRVEVLKYVDVLNHIAEDPPIYDSVSYPLAVTIAKAIQRDSRLSGLPGSFYLGLMRVENPQLEPFEANWYGAYGLTQVVPKFWEGTFPKCGDLLTSVYAQLCYGARVYLSYLDEWGDEILALYAYNGCTQAHRARKARCINFPNWVRDYTQEYEEYMY